MTRKAAAGKKPQEKNQLIPFLNRYALYLAAFAVVLTYLLYLSPTLDQIKRDQFALSDYQRKLEERRTALANQQVYVQQLSELKRKIAYIESFLRPLDADKIARLIEEAAKGRVKVNSISISEEKSMGSWATIQVSLNGRGSYKGIYEFVRQIESSNEYPASFSDLNLNLEQGAEGEAVVAFTGVVAFVGLSSGGNTGTNTGMGGGP